MLRRRIFFPNFVKGDHSTKRSRISIGTSDRKNLESKSTRVGIVDGGKLEKRKMGHRRTDSEGDRFRKKRRIRGNHSVDDGNADVDMISELPEPIIHHIFSFLHCAKDVVRTSTLSKRWKRVFDSYPVLDLDQRRFRVQQGKGKHNRIKAREIQRKKFKSYAEKSLALKLDSVACIDKFRLYASNASDSMINSMQHWVCSVVEKKVKELDIHFDALHKCFPLPINVAAAASITSLKLSGSAYCGFTVPRKMSNLRELSLKDSDLVTEYTIKRFEEGCPLMEDLRLVRCSELLQLAIPNLLRLRRVEVHECIRLKSIEIESANLETFWYHAAKSQVCKINLKGSGNLKNLTLRDQSMTETAIQDCISKCPLLEKLVLQECSGLEKLTILSGRLKNLTLIRCEHLHEANIDAPNLYSFEYSGHRMPFSSMNVVGLHKAKFSFGPSIVTSQCIVDYRKLFGSFDQSKKFKLIIYSKQNMKIFEEPKEARLVPHFFHKLELTKSLASVLKTVDNWLRECHGRSLVLVSPSSELTKLLNSLIMERDDSPNCCRMYSNKCWRHYLASVKTLNPKGKHKTCYEFRWRSEERSH